MTTILVNPRCEVGGGPCTCCDPGILSASITFSGFTAADEHCNCGVLNGTPFILGSIDCGDDRYYTDLLVCDDGFGPVGVTFLVQWAVRCEEDKKILAVYIHVGSGQTRFETEYALDAPCDSLGGSVDFLDSFYDQCDGSNATCTIDFIFDCRY